MSFPIAAVAIQSTLLWYCSDLLIFPFSSHSSWPAHCDDSSCVEEQERHAGAAAANQSTLI